MVTRRSALRLGLAAGAGGLARGADAQTVPQSGLVFPDGYVPGFIANPSPPVTPFIAPLNVMPIMRPVSVSALNPPPDPLRHQRYNEFLPKKYYIQNLGEFRWVYHPDPPYNQGSWAYGFDGITPGATLVTRYGEPVLVRRIDNLPPVGMGNISFAMPSSTIHSHNGHQASESDGNPVDYTNPGEFWDHHYPMFPAGMDPNEALGTLWYHDHRLDFTAPNVYAGLAAFQIQFDSLDSGNEIDQNPAAFRLPSGKFDVPLILHDILFDQHGQPVWDFTGSHPMSEPAPGGFLPSAMYTNHGIIVDFSQYQAGDHIFLSNRLGMRPDGAGISGKLDQNDQIMRFDVVGGAVPDPSRIPDFMRPLPPIDLSQVKRHRTFVFDYDNGLWTINGRLMDPNRIDAAIKIGTPDIWPLQNAGTNWSHPTHTHFEEFQILSVNGKPVAPGTVLKSRKDVVQLGPGDEVKFYGHWRDFLGKYVMHCHNVVHEDHAMMLRWDIVPPGQGY